MNMEHNNRGGVGGDIVIQEIWEQQNKRRKRQRERERQREIETERERVHVNYKDIAYHTVWVHYYYINECSSGVYGKIWQD